MKTKLLLVVMCIAIWNLKCGTWNCSAQNIAINSGGTAPDASALLDVGDGNTATGGDTKGLLIPRVALTSSLDAVTISAPATSLLIYNTATAGISPNNVVPGYYYWDGAQWVPLGGGGGGGNAWLLTGNAGTIDGTNFLGTTDDRPFNIRVNNQKAGRIENDLAKVNTFFGYQAGNANTAGWGNTATGHQALYSNTTGSNNTAVGLYALYSNTTIGGSNNTAIGRDALHYNTTGSSNTASGLSALLSNSTGSENTANGYQALVYNTTGNSNTANGISALYGNTTGNQNTAIGDYALAGNVAGSNATAIGYNAMLYANSTATAFTSQNTAVGFEALRGSTNPAVNTGNYNTAIGNQTLWSNTTGNNNTAIGNKALNANTTGIFNAAGGVQALYSNTTGNYNAAHGMNALQSNTFGNNNTAVGFQALQYNISGSDNTALGYFAGYDGATHSQCTFIGSQSALATIRTNVTLLGYGIVDAQCTGNNQVCIGNTAVTQVRAPAAVVGFTAYSDARFKTNIRQLTDAAGLDFILKLKPVTYNVLPRELHKIWSTPDSVVSKMDFSEAEKEIRIGFVAQDVEKAAKECGFDFPGIDVPKNEKEVYTLRYVDFIMPMVKAMQEQQKIINSQQSTIDKQQSAIGNLQTENKILNTKMEKMEELLGAKAEK